MINFNNIEKRWLEIVFYLICNKIFSINQKTSDIIDFITGYRWTNMFNYDILIDTITKEKILLNSNFIPSTHEFCITLNHEDCRLRMTGKPLFELIHGTSFKYFKGGFFRAQMKEEIKKTEVFPKLDTPHIHETIYSFLLALRYIADIIKIIKF